MQNSALNKSGNRSFELARVKEGCPGVPCSLLPSEELFKGSLKLWEINVAAPYE